MKFPHAGQSPLPFDFADLDTGGQRAVFNLTWSNGIQEKLSQPVAVLLDAEAKIISIASQVGYGNIVCAVEFLHYVRREFRAEELIP